MRRKRLYRPKKAKLTKAEFSKRVAAVILLQSLFYLGVCILSYWFGVQIPEVIPDSLIKVIIGTYLVYCLKAFFGKKEEMKNTTNTFENIEESGVNELD